MAKQRPGSFWHLLADGSRKPPLQAHPLRGVNWEEYRSAAHRIVFYTLLAALIGVIVGAIDAFFGIGLLILNDFRAEHPFFLIPFLGLAGVLIMWVYVRYGGKATRGMGLIFAVGYEQDDYIPLRMIPLTIFGTWVTHLFGGSAGREGVAVQIGATVSMAFARFLPKGEHQRILLLSGMAAGFGGLFGTPMAGTFFALEVLIVGSIFYEALVPALIAAWVASFTSRALGLQSMFMPMVAVPQLTPQMLVTIIVAGLCFGVVGKLFAWLLYHMKIAFAHLIRDPIVRIAVIGSVLAVFFLLFDSGRYSGLSDPIFLAAFTNGTIYYWDWALKLILTVVTLAAGFQGGELAPCFVIGAALGFVLGDLFGVPTQLLAACGCAAVFGSATKTLLAPIFIGVEIFGTQTLPYFFIVCVTAYVVAGHDSIYVGQKELTQLLPHRISVGGQKKAGQAAEDDKRKEEKDG